MKTSVAKRGMGAKANEIKYSYANVNKLTMHDVQVYNQNNTTSKMY